MDDINSLFNGIPGLDMVLAGVTAVFSLFIILFIRRAVGPNKKLLQHGIDGRATIIDVHQTGVRINNNPQIALTLQVYVPGMNPYRAQTKQVIPFINIPQFQPGAELPVKVDPTKPEKIALNI